MIQEDCIVFRFLLFFISFSVFANNSVVERNLVRTNTFESSNPISYGLEYDVYNGSSYINPSISYTTTDRIDIFLQSQNIPINDGGAQSLLGDTYFGASKFFKLSNHNAIIIGSQLGYSVVDFNKLHSFSYGDFKWRPIDWFIVHGGVYDVNSALSQTNHYVGGLAGLELNFPKMKYTLDYYGGHSNVSGAVFMMTDKHINNFRPYIGVGIPEKNSGNEFYGILGFTLSR